MGVSTKVFVNFKDFSQANLHIVKDFIDYVRILGYTNKTNRLGKKYLDDNFNLHLDKWSMFTQFHSQQKMVIKEVVLFMSH